MSGIEGIVRPFGDPVSSQREYVSGSGTPSVSHIIGYPGGTKHFGWTFSMTTTFRISRAHREKPPKNDSMRNLLNAGS